MAAVKQNGSALENASEDLRGVRDIVIAPVNQFGSIRRNRGAIKFA